MSMPSDEVLLRTTDCIVAGMPTLACSYCDFEADHFFYYEDKSYANRIVKRCPECGKRIFGVVVLSNAKA